MSDTLKTIREAFKSARKARDTDLAAFLSTVIGDIESKAVVIDGVKTVSEQVVIAALKSFEKKCGEMLAIVPDNAQAVKERNIIIGFLPAQLSESEIRAILVGTGITEMPRMMAYLKENFAGTYDGKIASVVAKELAK